MCVCVCSCEFGCEFGCVFGCVFGEGVYRYRENWDDMSPPRLIFVSSPSLGPVNMATSVKNHLSWSCD